MKIIVDFDDVVFNTRKFYEDYKGIFVRHGVPVAQFDYSRQKSKAGKIKTYSLERHLKFIKNNFKIDGEKLRSGIGDFIKQNRKYIFRDVNQFLGEFPRCQLYLLSRADDAQWQASKIKNSGISRYFKKIIICAGVKSDSICQILKKAGVARKENVFFIDDRVEHLEDVKKCYPQIFTILMRRKEGRYNDKKNKYCDFEAKNLKEAVKIIEDLAH